MGEARLRGSLQGLHDRTSAREGNVNVNHETLTMNGSLRRSICANALKRTNVRLRILVDRKNTDWEFIRKCGSASSDDNRSREASSHVGQYGVSNGHDPEYVGFELTDYPFDAAKQKGAVRGRLNTRRDTYPPSSKIILTPVPALFTKMSMRPQTAIASATLESIISWESVMSSCMR